MKILSKQFIDLFGVTSATPRISWQKILPPWFPPEAILGPYPWGTPVKEADMLIIQCNECYNHIWTEICFESVIHKLITCHWAVKKLESEIKSSVFVVNRNSHGLSLLPGPSCTEDTSSVWNALSTPPPPRHHQAWLNSILQISAQMLFP